MSEVQRQLGHASIQLTVDTYGKWLPLRNKAAVNRLDDESRSKTVAKTKTGTSLTADHLQHYTSKTLRSFYEMTRSNGAVPRHATVASRPDFLKLTIGRLTDVCRATVENLHSPSNSTKGAESLGPFGFATFRGCGGWI